jgi:hypothetical protein
VSDEQQIRRELLDKVAKLEELADELRGRRSEISIAIAKLDREVEGLLRHLRQLEEEA